MASATPNATPAVDATYGQRSVFGGDGLATAPTDADLDCEDEQEALAYLRLVRDEASKIPHVMVMPRHGPQALPPGYAAAAAAASAVVAPASSKQTTPKKKRRRRKHWDEQDDGLDAEMSYGDDNRDGDFANNNGNGNGNAAKKRRVSRQQAVAVGLSYDDEGPGDGGLNYEEDEKEAKAEEDYEDEGEVSDANAADNHDEDQDYTLEHHDLYHSSVGDSRGYYHDGAYVAAPAEEDSYGAPAQAAVHTNGHSADDAYTHVDADNGADPDLEAESAQFSSAYRSRLLLVHFAQLRAIVRPSPEDFNPDQLADAVAALPPDHDTDVGPLSTRSGVYRRWLYLLRTTDPLPAQIAAMDKVSVLRLLRVLLRGLLAGGSKSSRSSRAGRFEQKLLGGGRGSNTGNRNGNGNGGIDMTGRTSRWLWSLLARLPDRGELDYREVGYIRDVAKQAVMRLAHLCYDMEGTDTNGGHYEEEEEEFEEGAAGEPSGDPDGEATEPKENELGQEKEKNETANDQDPEDVPMDMDSEAETGEAKEDEEGGATKKEGQDSPQGAVEDGTANNDENEDEDGEMQQRATLEMVLAVAGELYGQRDLLAFRTPWPAASSN